MVGFTPNGRLVTADVEDEEAMVGFFFVLYVLESTRGWIACVSFRSNYGLC